MQTHTHTHRQIITHTHSPADEAPTDGHLFTLVHHAGPGLGVHHSILVGPPRLAPTLNPTTHTYISQARGDACVRVCVCQCAI